MATSFENVRMGSFGDDGLIPEIQEVPYKLEIKEESQSLCIKFFNGKQSFFLFVIHCH